jgi:hypothetical protein
LGTLFAGEVVWEVAAEERGFAQECGSAPWEEVGGAEMHGLQDVIAFHRVEGVYQVHG